MANCLFTGCLIAWRRVPLVRACVQSWFLLYIIWRLQQEAVPPVIVWCVLLDAWSTLVTWVARALICVQTMQLASISSAMHLTLVLWD